MKKKVLIISCLGLFVIGLCFGLYFSLRSTKFSLEKEYYKDSGLVDISSSEVDQLIKQKKSFLLFTYNSFCSFSVPCDTVFEESAKKKNIVILQIPFDDFKKTTLHKKITYGPSVILVKEGKIVDYLDAGKDEDVEKYQDSSKFIEWISKYINYA